MAEEEQMVVGVEERAERRIIVAVDEGEESMDALSWCLNNVVTFNNTDTVILVYAMPPRFVYAPMDGTGYLLSTVIDGKDVVESMEKYGKDVADSVMEKAKAFCSGFHNIKVETKVQRGDPRDVICDMVGKLGGDMLVMGSHGYGLIKRALLGSVSNHCAQNANCPVLIVKKPKPKH